MKDKLLEADGTAIYLKAYREAEKDATYHLVQAAPFTGEHI